MIIFTSPNRNQNTIWQTIKHQINYNNIATDGGLITWLCLMDPTLQVATILIAMAPKILKLATLFVKKSP